MSHSVAYAIAAMVCYGLGDYIYKQAAVAGIQADHFLMAQGWFFCPLVILYALASGTLIPDPAALWGSVAGIFAFTGFYYFVRSLVAGSVSTNAPIFRMNFIVTALLAIVLLGEPMTPAKITGLAFAMVATWLLVGAKHADDRIPSNRRRRALAEVAVATIAFGASNFFHTVGLRHGAVPETLVVAQAAAFMPLATFVVYLADRKFLPPPATFKYGAAAAIVLLTAIILLLHGVAYGQASVLVPIAQMGFIITAMLGIFILDERITVRKTIGLVLALAALAALMGS
jgi:drug/metabolite transporter (DMT)-like permease